MLLKEAHHTQNVRRHAAVATIRSCLTRLAIMPLFLLASCVPLPTSKHPHSAVSANSTILFSVTLRVAAIRPQPTGLVVNVESQQGAAAKSFAFTPNTRIPGNQTTFLVRLDLSAGRYTLSRFTAIAADGMPIAGFDVLVRITMDMRRNTTDYMGHIELSTETSSLMVVNAYEDEIPSFVHAWPALRGRVISHHILEGSRIPVQMAGRIEPQRPITAVQTEAAPGPAAMGPLDSNAATGLSPEAQRAFRVFLRSRQPRAFAVTVSGGYTGMASGGSNVIGRALQNCRRAQPMDRKASCRLFALDDTLMSSVYAEGVARRRSTREK